jgi:hypothetical protein
MGFTTPKTWSSGETLTAANFNIHIRDNLNANRHLIVEKTSDQSIASSTTLTNDTQLAVSIGANEIWDFEWMLMIAAHVDADAKIAFTFPTGGTVALTGSGFDAAGTFGRFRHTTTTSPTTATSISGTGDYAVPDATVLTGTFTNGGTAGTLQLQWAQNTSNASATIMKRGSAVYGRKIA